jgi:hypothetical protein
MAGNNEKVEKFFARYSAALLSRDATAMGDLYAVPALILFPGNVVLVTDRRQTEEFFASAWPQYEGVDSVRRDTTIMGAAPGSVWADVTWSFDARPPERFCYQLIGGEHGYRIAVLTPMA